MYALLGYEAPISDLQQFVGVGRVGGVRVGVGGGVGGVGVGRVRAGVGGDLQEEGEVFRDLVGREGCWFFEAAEVVQGAVGQWRLGDHMLSRREVF